MASNSSRKRAVDPPVIPDRLYFKIGDVARLCAVEPYVLRFWETQFPQLKPNKSGTGQRLYRRREVELALEIKRLVHGEGYTISGARHALETTQRRSRPPAVPARTAANEVPAQETAKITSRSAPEAVVAAVGQIRAELREIASLLSAQQPRPARPRGRIVALSPESGSLFPV
jgi:DNA-binding transcriptional MerR regulator